METIRLEIEGMHCGACVRRVTQALEGIDGVRVDLVEVGLASAQFDPRVVGAEQIAKAVERIGFPARVKI